MSTTDFGPMHPFAENSDRIASNYWNTSGRGTNKTRKIRITRAAMKSRVPTCEGGLNSREDVEAMETVGSEKKVKG